MDSINSQKIRKFIANKNLHMLLLLSGDVELNPGPMINDQPDTSSLHQWLEPLVDWQSFGLICL